VLDAATPGLLICLGVGGIMWSLAPVLLVVAFVLTGRVKAARDQVRQAFAIGLGLVGVLALIKLFNAFDFTDWWHFIGWWSLVVCWGLVVSTVLLVRSALRSGAPTPPPTYRGPWG
jgi:FtsH-binding integral membrane protein